MATKNRLFDSILVRKPKLNAFDLSYENRLTCNFGELVPCFVKEVLPGDKWKNKTELMVRMAPLVAPIMSRIDCYVHFFFVPNRLVWDGWEDFITSGEQGSVSTVPPNVGLLVGGNTGPGTVYDYLGCPYSPVSTSTVSKYVSALPFRAYNLIFNEYYRDELLQTAVSVPTTTGTDSAGIYSLLKRCWEKDYFTSARPNTQLGAAVSLPISGTPELKAQLNGVSSLSELTLDYDSGGSPRIEAIISPTPSTSTATGKFVVDASTINAGTVNELRRAIKLQEWQEKNARSGNRYIENILSHFGVKSSDARLQRPQYLGGGKTPVVVSEVLQTSASTASVQSGQSMTPQGNMAGHGISIGSSNEFQFTAEEHGFILGILSIMPRTAYQQGTPRYLSHRSSRFDYAWPEFAHLGEQEVFQDELYDVLGVDNSQVVFGYQSRYAEYKFSNSEVHGDFRSSLAFWHNGRIFDSAPLLNSSFVSFGNDSQNASQNRVFAVTNNNVGHFYVQMFHNCQALRPLPKFGTPSF